MSHENIHIFSSAVVHIISINKMYCFTSLSVFLNHLTLIYSQTCLMRPSKETLTYGHIRHVVTRYRFN